MHDIIDAAKAAHVMGCSQQMVRERVKRGIWQIGQAVTGKESGRQKIAYEIHKKKLAEFLGITLEEVDRRLEEVNK